MKSIGYIDFIKNLKKMGIQVIYKNSSSNKTFNQDVYDELKKLFEEYKEQLQNENKKMQATTQMTLDMRLCTALHLAFNKEQYGDDAIAYLNAVKAYFVEQM